VFAHDTPHYSVIPCTLADQPLWSDRRIAHVCGVSPKLVARLRCDGPVAPAAAAREKRVGRDGRARPLKPGAIRGDIAKAIRESPCASLRMIAAELGVSPETVRSVRSELALCRGLAARATPRRARPAGRH